MPRLSFTTKPRPDTLEGRNIRIKGRRTSVRLESLEWQAIDRIAQALGKDVHAVCEGFDCDPKRKEKSRTSRIRMGVLQYYMEAGERPAMPREAIRASDRRAANT